MELHNSEGTLTHFRREFLNALERQDFDCSYVDLSGMYFSAVNLPDNAVYRNQHVDKDESKDPMFSYFSGSGTAIIYWSIFLSLGMLWVTCCGLRCLRLCNQASRRRKLMMESFRMKSKVRPGELGDDGMDDEDLIKWKREKDDISAFMNGHLAGIQDEWTVGRTRKEGMLKVTTDRGGAHAETIQRENEKTMKILGGSRHTSPKNTRTREPMMIQSPRSTRASTREEEDVVVG